MADTTIMPGGKPDPDPTLLTTQALLREIASIKELFDARLKSIDEKVAHLKELEQKDINMIEIQFRERDTRTEQTAKGNKEAIDAAFAAAKEGVGKQEVLFTKQIDAMNDKIEDVKTRFIANEGHSIGRTEGTSNIGAMAVGAAFIISTLVSVAALILTLTHH
jgi:hypothetical protein